MGRSQTATSVAERFGAELEDELFAEARSARELLGDESNFSQIQSNFSQTTTPPLVRASR